MWFAALVIAACSKSDPPKQDDPPPAPKHHEDRNEPATAAPALELAIVVDGKPATWHRDDFAKTQHFQSKNDHGGDARDTWSLRELAHGLVGPSARVTAVIGNKTESIDPAAWSDDTHTPILHTTRRGTLKFRWADKDGKWADALVNDVTRVELATR
jgi:hypothetical protein